VILESTKGKEIGPNQAQRFREDEHSITKKSHRKGNRHPYGTGIRRKIGIHRVVGIGREKGKRENLRIFWIFDWTK
jgi:hypothetical protein